MGQHVSRAASTLQQSEKVAPYDDKVSRVFYPPNGYVVVGQSLPKKRTMCLASVLMESVYDD
jgi:hypothetical protein